jgi:hypothetical protein
MNHPSWLQSQAHADFAAKAAQLLNQGHLQDLEPSLLLNLLQIINTQLESRYEKLGQLQSKISFECELIFGEQEPTYTLDELYGQACCRRLTELDIKEKCLIANIKQLEEAVEKLGSQGGGR